MKKQEHKARHSQRETFIQQNTKHAHNKNIHSAKHKTHNTYTTRKHPAWLFAGFLAGLPLPFDELSLQVGDCPDLGTIKQQGWRTCVSHLRQHGLTSQEELLPLKLCHCYCLSQSPSSHSHVEINQPSSFHITQSLSSCTRQNDFGKANLKKYKLRYPPLLVQL